MTRCEDYPCCGHTDGLGCDWTTPDYTYPEDLFEPGSQEYWDARWEREESEDDDHDSDDCPYGGCSSCDGDLSQRIDQAEDFWLDGSYEQ